MESSYDSTDLTAFFCDENWGKKTKLINELNEIFTKKTLRKRSDTKNLFAAIKKINSKDPNIPNVIVIISGSFSVSKGKKLIEKLKSLKQVYGVIVVCEDPENYTWIKKAGNFILGVEMKDEDLVTRCFKVMQEYKDKYSNLENSGLSESLISPVKDNLPEKEIPINHSKFENISEIKTQDSSLIMSKSFLDMFKSLEISKNVKQDLSQIQDFIDIHFSKDEQKVITQKIIDSELQKYEKSKKTKKDRDKLISNLKETLERLLV